MVAYPQTYQQFSATHSQHAQLWQALLASRHYAPVAVGCIGDSFTGGFNPGLTSWEQTWPLVLANMVTARYPVVGLATYGRGCLVPKVNSNLTLDYLAVSGPGSPLAVPGYGFNLATYDISNGGGCTLTYSLVGDTAVLCYANQPGGGTFSYKVDAGAATNQSTAGGAIADNQFIEVALGARGAHTLTIAWVSGGPTWFDGVLEYNGDINAGCQFFNMGSADSTAANWAGWNPGMFAAVFMTGAMIEVGAADWLNGTSPASFQASLTALIAHIRAAMGTPINYLLVVPPQPQGAPASGSATWQQFVNAMYAVSAAAADVDIIDFTLRMPVSNGAGGPYGLYASNGELTNWAHSEVADTLCAYLGPA
jgi:hypothetical protein